MRMHFFYCDNRQNCTGIASFQSTRFNDNVKICQNVIGTRYVIRIVVEIYRAKPLTGHKLRTRPNIVSTINMLVTVLLSYHTLVLHDPNKNGILRIFRNINEKWLLAEKSRKTGMIILWSSFINLKTLFLLN